MTCCCYELIQDEMRNKMLMRGDGCLWFLYMFVYARMYVCIC